MASASPPPPGAGIWVAHTTAEGRPYWHHSITNSSVWQKPRELKTPAELEMEATPWEEYASGGRPYWVHKETKETTWEMPREIGDILARASAAPPVANFSPHHPAPAFVPQQTASPHLSQGSPLARSNNSGFSPLPAQPSTHTPLGPRGPSALPSRPNVPLPAALSQNERLDFNSAEDAEQAFMGMLSRIGVTPEWTWERTMREAITEPLYKALKTLAERKNAFERFVRLENERALEERKARLARSREHWTKVLDKLHGGKDAENGVKSWWDWPSRRPALEKIFGPAWAWLNNDSERQELFEEYIAKLKQGEEQVKQEQRAATMAKLSSLLRSLQLDLAGSTRWREAHELLRSTPEWGISTQLQGADASDILAVFEEEVKLADREAAEARARKTAEKRREARKARERFDAVLQQLEEEGVVCAGARWMEVFPKIEKNDAYLALLAHAGTGSTALDLFWDRVDRLDQEAERDLVIVERAMERKGFTVTEESKWEEFEAVIEGADGIELLTPRFQRSAFEMLRVRAIRQNKERRRKMEKQLRLEIDDLRYAYKKLDPPVELDATYDDVLPRIKDTAEFIALTDEEATRTAFDKFIRRQKEKLKEKEEEVEQRAREEREYAEAKAAAAELKKRSAPPAQTPAEQLLEGQPPRKKTTRMSASALMDAGADEVDDMFQ